MVTTLPDNVLEKPGIKSIHERTITFENSEEVCIDNIIFCTGYKFSFPFLSDDCSLNITDFRITPLYKHIIDVKQPTLAIIGLPSIIIPFMAFHYQILFVLAAWEGTLTLPDEDTMLQDVEQDYQLRLSVGYQPHLAHYMYELQWDYYATLINLAGQEPLPIVKREMYDRTMRIRKTDLIHAKNFNFEIKSKTNFTEHALSVLQ